jgi:hypothetical protein
MPDLEPQRQRISRAQYVTGRLAAPSVFAPRIRSHGNAQGSPPQLPDDVRESRSVIVDGRLDFINVPIGDLLSAGRD